jgi:hypothetical protein
LHDHPWSFWSVILWRGYVECTPGKRRRIWPGMILHRRPEWRHRVELLNEKNAVTLVIMGRYVREWGFWTSKGWQHWQKYFAEKGC